MQQSNAVKLTLLRHVPLSATETNALKQKARLEPQVCCEINQQQVVQVVILDM